VEDTDKKIRPQGNKDNNVMKEVKKEWYNEGDRLFK
jgi:hypothetical protein